MSFPTISGTGPNGAIVHYRVTRKSNQRIAPGDLLLIDSGAQYEDGTLSASPEALAEAQDFMYLAEGSDWFWWYGTDQDSGQDSYFDEGYRALLKGVYTALGAAYPAYLECPVYPVCSECPVYPVYPVYPD